MCPKYKLAEFKLYTGVNKEGLKKHDYKIKLKQFENWEKLLIELKGFTDVTITGLELKEREFDNI